MTADFTVLWPITTDPEIEEIRFSHEFCRNFSKTFCRKADPQVCWVDYTDDADVQEVLTKVEGSTVILITQPEVVLSPPGVQSLLDSTTADHSMCGPVYNLTPIPQQTATLPAQYVDMDTFLEMAEQLKKTKNSEYHELIELDTACVSYRVDLLKKLDPSTHVTNIFQESLTKNNRKATVATDALVHQGFQNAFGTERDDLVRLVPPGTTRVLDVGCAMGGYGKLLKRTRPEIFLSGVEMNPRMADTARPFYDEIHVCAMEDVRFQQKFDLINCGDILEHLIDPWKMLKRFSILLRSGGHLVLSVPNIGHWSIVKALLKGHFQYIPLGLLCIGHLRWFTESSIRDALATAGFEIEIFEKQQIPPTPSGRAFIRHICAAGYGDEQSLKTNEVILRAAKSTMSFHSKTKR